MFCKCSLVRNPEDILQRDRARAMRKDPTPAERAIWRMLRHDQLGVRFRRQYRIGPYIVDFLCPAHRLVVEIDGGQHNGSDYDVQRDRWLTAQGYRVLRFWNRDVLTESDSVGQRICLSLQG